MPRQVKRTRIRENQSRELHREMNMRVAPTRLEPAGMFPAYIIPDLDPLQRQINRIQNTVEHEARYSRRRAWRKESQRS